MSMRVSTAQINSSGTSGIVRLQSDLYTQQNQISTGRRVVTPKDDPVDSAQALVVTQSKSINALFIKNQQTAETKLNALDATLDGLNNELRAIYEKSVAAGNGSYSDSERAAIATELEQRLGNLVSLGNTQDGSGRYIFSGFQSTTKPFDLSGNVGPYSLANPYVTYAGDDGVQTLQVAASVSLDTSSAGSEVFMRVKDASGNVTGRSVFDAVQNMVVFLRTPGVSPSSVAYRDALGDVMSSMDSISRVRASVGSSLSSLDTLSNTSSDREVQYKTQLSNLQDLDYASAFTSLSQKKIQLEAAQTTYMMIAKLSLFDHL